MSNIMHYYYITFNNKSKISMTIFLVVSKIYFIVIGSDWKQAVGESHDIRQCRLRRVYNLNKIDWGHSTPNHMPVKISKILYVKLNL